MTESESLADEKEPSRRWRRVVIVIPGVKCTLELDNDTIKVYWPIDR